MTDRILSAAVQNRSKKCINSKTNNNKSIYPRKVRRNSFQQCNIQSYHNKRIFNK